MNKKRLKNHSINDYMLDKNEDRGSLDIKAINNWRIFRIMAELVEGWQFLSHYNKKITIFGSARIAPANRWYKETVKLSQLLARDGFDIVTGGGPGIMEAANKGAHKAQSERKKSGKEIGESIGLDIQLPLEQEKNKYVKRGRGFNYFFVRKVMLSYHARGYIFFPGGFGTLDEAFEILTLIQTNKLEAVPIIFVGKEFWTPLFEWIETTVLNKFKNISRPDLKLYKLADNAEEAYEIIKEEFKET